MMIATNHRDLGANEIFTTGMLSPPGTFPVNSDLSILKIASTYAEAFESLLQTYEQIGENMPLLAQYEVMFYRNPYMRKVLELIYVDILEFHKKALRYFKQRSERLSISSKDCPRLTTLVPSVEAAILGHMENISYKIWWNFGEPSTTQKPGRKSGKLSSLRGVSKSEGSSGIRSTPHTRGRRKAKTSCRVHMVVCR
jgi:hypothetical protein